MKQSPLESSLLATLTNVETPARTGPLSLNCAVIVLSRTLRALNRLSIRDFDELNQRRESAAVLVFLRIEIERDRARESADA
jgi:hypothetical protein